MNRFGKQFKALENPLTLTVTIAEKRDERELLGSSVDSNADSSIHSEMDASTNAGENPYNGALYRLTLESNRQDATVDFGDSFVNKKRIGQTLTQLEQLIKNCSAESDGPAALGAFTRNLGEDIFQSIDLDNQCAGNNGLPHLHLQLPIELMGYPWEVMDDGKGMLCNRFAIGRQAIMEQGLARPPRIRSAKKIRVLIIGDPLLSDEVRQRTGLTQLPGAREEAHEVQLLFRMLSKELRGTIELQEEDIQIGTRFTTVDLRQRLRDGKYDIVHFAGHAHHDECFPERSSWWLSDGDLWAQGIRNTLDKCHSPPWLVYANACESATDSATAARYRSNVYGLATSFINEGVTAYVGPLWPINDAVAGQMATDFYRELLLERTTIGESLYCAKHNARQRIEDSSSGVLGDLSWAGMVIYGNSTMKLLDSLGTDQSQAENVAADNASSRSVSDAASSAATPRYKFRGSLRSARPLQESVYLTQTMISGAGMNERGGSDFGSSTKRDKNDVVLQLVEVNGLRFWQYRAGDEIKFQGLPGSGLKEEIETNERLRNRLGLKRSVPDAKYTRLLGQWGIDDVANQKVDQILASYDSESVKREQIVAVDEHSQLAPLGRHDLERLRYRLSQRSAGRILLLLHGAFGNTEKMVKALGKNFIRRASRNYAAIVGYDHWALQHTASENATELWSDLEKLVSQDGLPQRENSVDLIGFGRGGLVARALLNLDLGDHSTDLEPTPERTIRYASLVGTPTFSSRLSQQDDLGATADLLANSLHLDTSGLYGKLSGALARFKLMDWYTPDRSNALRRKIQAVQLIDSVQRQTFIPAETTHYLIVASEYAPSSMINIPRIVKENCIDSRFFLHPHDLIVGTRDACRPDLAILTQGAAKSVSMLLIKPDHKPLFESNDDFSQAFNKLQQQRTDHRPESPSSASGCELVIARRNGVHHANLLATSECQEFLSRHLFTD